MAASRTLGTVDQELLESTLDLSNASRVDSLLRVADGRLPDGGGGWCWGWLNRLVVDQADQLLVFDGSWLGGHWIVVDDRDLETKL